MKIFDLEVSLVRGTKAELVHCNLSHFIFPQGVISSDGLEKEGGKKIKKKREREMKVNSVKYIKKENIEVIINKNADENEIKINFKKERRIRIDKSINTGQQAYSHWTHR